MWKRKSCKEKNLLVFLDVDGVLNTTNSRITKYEIREENVKALGMLKDKLQKRGFLVEVILSSTWRLGFDSDIEKCSKQMQRLVSMLGKVNLEIYDRTPIYKDQTRDVEINRYIRGYHLKNEDFEYIILDDDVSIFNKDALKKMNFYKVSERTGLTAKDVEKIVKMF